MRLASFRVVGGAVHRQRGGIVIGDAVVELQAGAGALGPAPVPNTVAGVFSGGDPALAVARHLAELASGQEVSRKLASKAALFPLSEVVLLAPLGQPRKNVFCLGLNYREHAAEDARKRRIPHRSRVITRVNGEVKQNSSTSDMIFSIDPIIYHLSLGMTLEPGDIIATGTPPGVGKSRDPSEFLCAGDVLETEIEGIGVMRNEVVVKGS